MNLIAQPEQSSAPGPLAARSNMQMGASNPINGNSAVQNVDIIGPLLRRKYVVILFAIIGTGIGYLAFQQAEPLYQSSARLMIWSQAPPTIVGEETFKQTISMEKYAQLFGSQAVLGRAIEDADLQKTDALALSGSAAVNVLQNSLRIYADEKGTDTLNVSMVGPNADELPGILNNVFDAFVKEIDENTKAAGDESVELITKLQRRMLDEKDVAEKRYLELLNSLGPTNRDAQGEVANPFVDELEELRRLDMGYQTELRNVLTRLELLKKAQAEGNFKALRVVAYAGRDYVGMEKTQSLDHSNRQTSYEKLESREERELDKKMSLLQSQVTAIEARLMDLGTARLKLLSKYGPRHQEILNLDQEVQVWTAKMTELSDQLGQLRGQWLTVSTDSESDEGADRAKEIENLKRKDEEEWLSMYATALEMERQRLVSLATDTRDSLNQLENKAGEMASKVDEVNFLKAQIEEKRSAVRSILDSLSGIDILADNYNNVRVRMVDQPRAGRQVAPNLLQYLVAGAMLALIVGCGLAILIDRADHSFRSPNEIVDIFRAPVIGRIPRIRVNSKLDSEIANTLVVAHQPNSSVAESMRAIRTAVFFNAANSGAKLLLFTSPSPGDGKSTTISNLAISMAQAGKKVCLVDCDFRRPRVHRYFGVKAKPGGKAYIQGDMTLEEAVQPSGVENLSLLTCGGHPENPGEFILQPQFGEMFAQLRDDFDFVLIDSPPVIPVSDPTVLAAYVDAIYMVLRIRKGVTVSAQQTVDTLSQVEAQIQGVIVNGVDQNPYYNEYNYNYGYQMLGGYYYNKYGGGRYYERYGEAYGDDDATKRRIAAEPMAPANGSNGMKPRRKS